MWWLGVIGANYIGPGRARLSACAPSDLATWRNLSPIAIFGEAFGDFEEWGSDWPLTLEAQPSRIPPQMETVF